MLTKFTVIAGNASEDLAKRVAKKLKCSLVKSELRVFPDGESKITLSSKPKKGKIVIVQSTYPPVDTNLLQALALVSKARQFSSNVTAVIPYMGYAKQDKEFLKGEIITISVIAKLFKAAGATRLIVVDFHSPPALRFFRFPTKNLSATSLLADHFKKYCLIDPLVVSPDLFWESNAKKFAHELGTSSTIALNAFCSSCLCVELK